MNKNSKNHTNLFSKNRNNPFFWRKLSNFILFIGFLCILIPVLFLTDNNIVLKISIPLLIISAISSVIIKFLFYRCPNCQNLLPIKDSLLGFDFCPHCGKQLNKTLNKL